MIMGPRNTYMIQIKTDEEIEVMRKSAKLAAEVLIMIEPYVKPGVTTNRLDEICHDFPCCFSEKLVFRLGDSIIFTKSRLST